MRLEGQIIGFDEYMNMTLDNAEEISVKKGERKQIGRILLKGDCITLLQEAPARWRVCMLGYHFYKRKE